MAPLWKNGEQDFSNYHRHLVKGCPPWWSHKLQWHVYMTDFWPSAIKNTYRQSKCDLRKPKPQESNYKDTLS
ncbi:hypothetical protein MTR_8g038360 [Medicago truncatula]|uniref:Uncharacterized protein n=1 Tax=Medicago truncatula TaxID=3880 RepID=G7LFA1_MEDTR|nr:hypothetical protein MTR_8g038360 [Medicago truncatula]